ncbi:carbonic anhydrase 2-like [Leptopilina boulardi]|uniref:carbonic anhydrase 2-like n=1 Tax=Leptopilina boulardi TaxID=63433 RepID=UPI0021F61063|nr:carbonic anhydrase 2-like [Leptopilina boulardi]
MACEECRIGFHKSGQSPIDIDDKSVVSTKFPQLILTGHWLNDGYACMVNNGETVKITLTGDRIPSTIKGGPLLDDVYEFENVHFHWGENNCRGSEHTINDTWFSMEAHAVHWNRKYMTFAECLNHKDGICVLAFLFLATDKNSFWSNFQLEGITDNLKYIHEPEIITEIPANCLYWIKSCLTAPSYYTYRGSLTTYPYNECVTWIISPKTIMISASQIDEFRKLKNDKNEKIKDNTRKVQNLRGRRVFLSC